MKDDKMKAALRAVAEKTGLTTEESAKLIIAWLEATDCDPVAAATLQTLREVNPTFEPMNN
jgi:hypothetical protein